ncbi:hypothetical protein [Pantoea sp. 1.19]|uniref:hypothetical protein n=1 Tax=Pantoea sp. 1.19 TaxID=1925589 RepID=UPI000948D860|nr:hypothetical protein [Pantoea sp. 1.19]
MSGFEAFNQNGKITIDSNNRSTIFLDRRGVSPITDVGAVQVVNPFTDGYSFGFSAQQFWNDGNLRWLRMNTGKVSMPGADMFEPEAGDMIRTSRNSSIQSGYLDVFDQNGNIVWSAKSAASMPRIIGFMDIPAGFDLQNNVFSIHPGFNPWILINSTPGNYSNDGAVSGYSGVVLKWDGSQLQASYVSKNQKSWSQILQSSGLRIPLAKFVGI